MRTARALGCALLVAASGAFAAPANASSAQSAGPQPSPAATASARPIDGELFISGELIDRLDSKTAKAGDRVAIKTRSTTRIANGAEIPKGSKLIGRVTGVKPVRAGNADAQIAVEFNRAELKDGQSFFIQGVIQSIVPNGDSGESDPMSAVPSSVPAGRAPGDMYGSTPSMTPPSQVPNQAQAGGGGSSAVGSGTAPGAVIARSGDLIIRTTAIPGLLLANHEQGPRAAEPSTILLGAKRDIDLEKGTRVVIAVASTPTAVPAGAN